MLLKLKTIGVVLSCAAVVACSKTPNENPASGPGEGTSRTASVEFAAIGEGDHAVYIFNKNENTFSYQSLMNEGWSEREGKRIIVREMIEGDYKFFFLSNKCTNLSLPELPTEGNFLNYDDMIISHKVLSSKEGCFAPADEIYMPDDMVLAGQTYTIKGNQTIEANLTRAVSKIDVQLAYGYKTTDAGGNAVWVPLPYPGGNIADLFDAYEIEVTDCGNHLALLGCNGKANVYQDYMAGDEAIRTIQPGDEDNADGSKTGFAVLSGPFILPPSADANMQVRVKLVPAAGSNLSVFEKTLVNGVDGEVNLPRNHRLTVTFWLEADLPTITATARITDMSDETTGDSGMWY